jgi:hypothetical protein
VDWHELLNDALITWAILNAIVSLMVVRNEGLTLKQKIGQLWVIWLVPVLGGVLIGIFHWTQSGSVPPERSPEEPGRGPPGVWSGGRPPPPSAGG